MEDDIKVPLLRHLSSDKQRQSLGKRVFVESKKLWRVVGPAILSRISTFSSLVITQACAGHLGDLELASLAMAITVLANFNSGFLLGMASALETLCGQAFGAKRHNMLGIYLQRSWIVLFLCAILILPVYIFATPILRWTGQPEELSVMSGKAAMWCIPLHFSFVFLYPLTRFLQSQLKNYVSAVSGIIAFVFHIILTWLFVYKMKLGLFGTIMTLNFSWWMNTGCQFAYVVCGGCPISWNGFSMEAFSGLGEFIKLSVASGVMLCLEYWYYSILILLSSTFNNAEIAVDALTISLNINGWVLMFAIAFFAGTGVRVANELGSGNGEAAKFATKVSVCTSLFIGFIFSCLIIGLQGKYGLIYTSSTEVLGAVNKLTWLLAITILLNGVQPVLSGVAVGSGWQAVVAYVNIGTYYLIGVPIGLILGFSFGLEIEGIWAGMIGGTAIQTLVLTYMTIKCDWDKEVKVADKRVKKWDVASSQTSNESN
ncbi:MATE efflux family protein, expressed [Zostera marina]|uniref:Protein DETOXIFICATION n=1 Tax=Zostera marina TaxID=29655 RepID=A0A0K9NPW1_ZOSMR|nr:MATE efflux family protein, expressed [Zostera marina]